MITYKEALHKAQKYIEEKGAYSGAAQVLLLEVANTSRADLYRDYNQEMPKETYDKFWEGVEKLANHEPLAYILGYQWFYGRKFKVNKDVLIPRCETEELVGNILADIDEYFPEGEIVLCDIGTGSGEIGITLSLEEPRVKAYASDISEEALVVAKENNSLLECSVNYLQGDMLQPYIENSIKVDILVSDPPYIPANQTIDRSVKEYEPHVALFGGEDGLFFYRKILEGAKNIIKDKAILAFEIGYDQREAIIELANKHFPDDRKEVLKDMEKKDRMLFIYHNI